LSQKYGIPFFETSAYSNVNIEKVSQQINADMVIIKIAAKILLLFLGLYRNVSVNTGSCRYTNQGTG
jgi:hypothetical protein